MLDSNIYKCINIPKTSGSIMMGTNQDLPAKWATALYTHIFNIHLFLIMALPGL